MALTTEDGIGWGMPKLGRIGGVVGVGVGEIGGGSGIGGRLVREHSWWTGRVVELRNKKPPVSAGGALNQIPLTI